MNPTFNTLVPGSKMGTLPQKTATAMKSSMGKMPYATPQDSKSPNHYLIPTASTKAGPAKTKKNKAAVVNKPAAANNKPAKNKTKSSPQTATTKTATTKTATVKPSQNKQTKKAPAQTPVNNKSVKAGMFVFCF